MGLSESMTPSDVAPDGSANRPAQATLPPRLRGQLVPRQAPEWSLAGGTADASLVRETGGAREMRMSDEAAVLWSLCDGERTVADIIALVRTAYPDVDGERLSLSVGAAFDRLVALGALTYASGDLSRPDVFEGLFGPELVNLYRPTPELLWQLELLRQAAFGILGPGQEDDVTERSGPDLGESGLAAARRADADAARAGGHSILTRCESLFDGPSWRGTIDRIVAELSRIVALDGERLQVSGSACYPPGGGLEWHSNHSAPLLRVYCIWAEKPKHNFFRYVDPRSDDIITLWEPPGWMVKSFVIPPSPYRLWHCIGAGSRRFSLGFRAIPD